MTQTMAEEKPALALPRLDRDLLETLARNAGADDVGFTDVDAPGLTADRENLSRSLPWAGAIMVFVRRLNRHAIRASLRNISSAAFQAGADDVKRTIHALERALEDRGIRAVGISGLFPFAFGRADGPPHVVALKRLAEAAGLGVMGTNRIVLHPRFGADIYLGAVCSMAGSNHSIDGCRPHPVSAATSVSSLARPVPSVRTAASTSAPA